MTSDNSAPDLTTTAGKLASLRTRLAETAAPVGDAAVEATHAAGHATARERVDALLDQGSFVEVDALARHRSTNFGSDAHRPVTDGVVAGYGTIHGRKVCVFSQDAQVFGGALGEVHAEKIIKVYDLALKTGVPVIGVHDSSGARMHEGIVTLGSYAKIFQRATQASGLIPQIAVVYGPCDSHQAYLPALSDITVTVADVPADRLGAHHVASDDADAAQWVRSVVSYLPQNNRAETPRVESTLMAGAIADNVTATDQALDAIIPDTDKPYDMLRVIDTIVDEGSFFAVAPHIAAGMLTGFARVEGRTVGIIANQPLHDAALTPQASEKAARFIRTCDAFNIPIVECVDTPGFTAGNAAAAAQLLYAYAEASVGKLTVITRNASGSAYYAMGAKDMGADLCFAWPTARIAVDTPDTAAAGITQDTTTNTDPDAFAATYCTPYQAAERGYIDAVIPPAHTRGHLIEGLRLLERKVAPLPAKKHGNMPL